MLDCILRKNLHTRRPLLVLRHKLVVQPMLVRHVAGSVLVGIRVGLLNNLDFKSTGRCTKVFVRWRDVMRDVITGACIEF